MRGREEERGGMERVGGRLCVCVIVREGEEAEVREGRGGEREREREREMGLEQVTRQAGRHNKAYLISHKATSE